MALIFLNAGHDILKDSGAVNSTWGVTEAQIVRTVTYMVEMRLREAGHRVLTMQQDNLCGESGPYSESVCGKANSWGADIFVSIHCNSAWTNLATGTETYCWALGGEGSLLAQKIQDHIVVDLEMANRGVREANYIVLRETSMPAVLVELGFINNTNDVAKLCSRKEDFAKAVADGILEYLAT